MKKTLRYLICAFFIALTAALSFFLGFLFFSLPIALGIGLGSVLFSTLSAYAFNKKFPVVEERGAASVVYASIEQGDKLGSGSYGEVFKISPSNSNEKMASKQPLSKHLLNIKLKNIDADKAINKAKKYLKKEAEIMKELGEHPNLIKLIAYQPENGYYIIMPLMQCSLEQAIQHDNFEQKLFLVLLSVFRGVKHMHDKSIIHCDIKPQNILIKEEADGNTTVCVADFGLAGKESELVGKCNGTLPWMAPEILLKTQTLSKKSDNYSAGLLIYYLAYKAHPFRGMTTNIQNKDEKIKKLVEAKNNFPVVVSGKFDFLNDLLQKAQRQWEDNRPDDIQEMIADLETLEQQQKFLAHTPNKVFFEEKTVAEVSPEEIFKDVNENFFLSYKEKIGEGADAKIFKVEVSARENCEIMALKRANNTPKSEESIKKEVNTMQTLGQHPNLMQLYYSDVDNHFIIMALMDCSLHNAIRIADFNIKQRIKYVLMSVFLGVKYIHGKGFIHCDIKSGNILVKKEEKESLDIRISDFGFAQNASNVTNKHCGTPHWLAPEVFTRNTGVTKKADIYSVSLLTYEIATDHEPFESIEGKNKREWYENLYNEKKNKLLSVGGEFTLFNDMLQKGQMPYDTRSENIQDFINDLNTIPEPSLSLS